MSIFRKEDQTASPRVSIETAPRSKARPLFILCLCAIYIVSPIDLLPELFLGPFGLVDDLGALFIAIKEIKKMLRGTSP